jgi:stage V sporulation protein G
MEITEVRISPSKGGKVRAFASIVLDDCFIVNDLRVVEGREGQIFVTMPARKGRSGQMRDIAHPLNTETRRVIEEKILEEYRSAVESRALVDRPRKDAGGAGKKGKQDRMSPMEQVLSRLFSEEFWTSEGPRATGRKSS